MSTTDGFKSPLLSTLDHVALVVRDLQVATSHYATLLGRAPDWRGTVDGAQHAWFQLRNMALDIITPVSKGYIGERAQTQIDQHGEGIWAMAFATTDIAKARHTLQRRGIASTDTRLICVTHAETKEERTPTTSMLATEATHGTTIFLVERNAAATSSAQSPIAADSDTAISGLDHIVITTPQPERAAALYGARLGLEMKLDRTNPAWGSRLMFFKCGDLIVEIAHDLKQGVHDGPDHAWGLSWRVTDIVATRARLAAAGCNVSDVRAGRKPGTQVFTVRDRNANVPTIVIGRND